MSRILLDTSAYSEHLRDHPEVKSAIQRASAIGLSVVSIGELRAGFLKGERTRRERRVLAELPCVASRAGHFRGRETAAVTRPSGTIFRQQGTSVPVNDVWIAATAAQHGLRVLTLDVHFLQIPQVIVDFFEPARPER